MMQKSLLGIVCLLFPLFLMPAQDNTTSPDIILDPSPGSYREDISVSIGGPERIEYRFSESRDDAWCPFLLPFHLTCPDGEERRYTVQVRSAGVRKTVSYVIDKRSPKPPIPDIPPGVYNREVSLRFSSGEDVEIYASVDSLPIQPLSAEGLRLEQDRLVDRNYSVYAYSRDKAGNASSIESFMYTLRKSYRGESFLRIHSPVPGLFFNPQLLVCNTDGFEWIRYSIDGRNPVDYGIEYSSPVLIDRTGSIRIMVAAEPEGGGDIIRKDILYSVMENGGIGALPPQGLYTEGITLPVPGDREFLFTLNDTIQESQVKRFNRPLDLLSVPGVEKVYTVRMIAAEQGDTLSSEYRFIYIIDGRTPVKPVITPSIPSPVSRSVELRIEGGTWQDIYYSVDGRTPDNRSTPYRGPFTVSLPENIGFGSIIVKAVAYGINGKKSPEASYLLTFDRKPPEVPEIRRDGPFKDGSYRFTPDPEYGTTVVYEMSSDDTDPPVPGESSPVVSGSLHLEIPRGMDENFLVRFAAIDEAGNISDPTDIYSAHIDRLPPEPPGLVIDETGLHLASESKVFYRVYRNDVGYEPEEKQVFREYEGPVSLSLPEEGSASYRAEAYCEDEAGNRSPTVTGVFRKSMVTVRKPVVVGVSGERLFNTPTVSLRVSPASVGDVVRYSFTTDGTEPDFPGPESPRAESVLSFDGASGSEVVYRVLFVSYSGDGSLHSDPVELSFIIDLLNPRIPVLKGFKNGGVYNSDISIHAEADKDDTVFFSITPDRAIPPDPFGPEGLALTDFYSIIQPEDSETEYRIRIGSIDPAGNRSLNETIYSVTIDKQNPVPPEPLGIPPDTVTTGNVHISFPPFPGKIIYTVSGDGTVPGEPDDNSAVYGEHIVLHGEPGRELHYTLRTACIDEAGNRSLYSNLYSCVIDQKQPELPESPGIEIIKDRAAMIVSWPNSSSDTIVFRIPELKETWYEYDAPQLFVIPETRNTVTVEYYARDAAGNRCAQKTLSLSLPFSSSTPLFTGVEDGGVYNDRVEIYKSAGDSLCRYSVGVNTDIPPQVTGFSQELPDSLSVTAVKGETVRYSIRVRMFPDQGGMSGLREQTATFLIDRDEPAPPEIDGIRDNVFYQDDRTISFSSNEGTIRFTINEKGEKREDVENFIEYTRPVALQTDEGSFSSYTVSAYVTDLAGNRSTVKEWNVSIDKEIIYVSDTGNDAYDGTRTHPFKTIQKAFEHSQRTGRRTIYIAGGYYPIEDSIELPGGVVLAGGYDAAEWSKTDTSETVFLPGTYFRRDRPLFHVEAGRNILKNIRIYDTSGLSSALLDVSDGECSIIESTMERTGAGIGTIIRQTGGVLYLNDANVRLSRSDGATAMNIEGGTVYISDSSVTGSGASGDLRLVVLAGESRILAGRSSFFPGKGRKTAAFSADNSSIVLTDCSVSTGTGSVSSTAFNLKNSILECAASTISGEEDSRISTSVLSIDSELTLYNSLLRIAGVLGAVGVRASGSVVNIATSTVEALGTEEFLYLFNLEKTNGYFYTNHMTAEGSDDFVVMKIAEGTLKWYSNSCSFQGGSTRSVCIEAHRTPFLSIANSIMIQSGTTRDGAFFRSDVLDGLECLCNDIYGWGAVAVTKERILADVELLNSADGNPLGGMLHGNLAEQPFRTFLVSKSGEFQLKESSLCVNNGFDVRPLGGQDRDWNGQARPNPYYGIKPTFDIGADEFYNE